jgi:glycosyltransferase involved in cell wall biosynthesis
MPADETGCGFYRLIEPCRVIAESTTDVEITVVLDEEEDGALEVDQHGKIGHTHVVGVKDPGCDVLVLQRPASRILAETIPYLQRHGVAVVVEFDDDFETIDPRNSAWRAYAPHLNPEQNHVWAKLCSQLADYVTVSTPRLLKRYGKRGMHALLPNYVPEAYLDVKPDPELRRDHIVVGWAGNSRTHPGDLEVMSQAPFTAMESHSGPTSGFRAIGDEKILHRCGFKGPDEEWGVELAHGVALADYPALLASLDVGLSPLADTRFNGSKSWLKGLEMAAVGVPFVASPTQQYRELAKLGAGDLVTTTTPSRTSWTRAILKLIEDGVYRERRASEGREAAAGLTIEGHAEAWVQAWMNAKVVASARGT